MTKTNMTSQAKDGLISDGNSKSFSAANDAASFIFLSAIHKANENPEIKPHVGSRTTSMPDENAINQSWWRYAMNPKPPKAAINIETSSGIPIKSRRVAMTPNAEVSHAGPVTPGLG